MGMRQNRLGEGATRLSGDEHNLVRTCIGRVTLSSLVSCFSSPLLLLALGMLYAVRCFRTPSLRHGKRFDGTGSSSPLRLGWSVPRCRRPVPLFLLRSLSLQPLAIDLGDSVSVLAR